MTNPDANQQALIELMNRRKAAKAAAETKAVAVALAAHEAKTHAQAAAIAAMGGAILQGNGAPLNSFVEHQAFMTESLMNAKRAMPTIPSAQQAADMSISKPDAITFALRTGTTPYVEGVDFNDPNREAIHNIAYELLPIWLAQFGSAYSARPSSILAMWIKSLNDGELNQKRVGDVASGSRGVDPWLLQHVVYRMSLANEPFNPMNMAAVAKKVSIEIYKSGAGTFSDLQLKWAQRPAFHYSFLLDTNPDAVVEEVKAPQSWVTLADYPRAFPTDIVLPKAILEAVNAVIQYRFNSESDFCSTCARSLAEIILQAIQCFKRDKNRALTTGEIFELAYRFSVRTIQTTYPHMNAKHPQQRKGKASVRESTMESDADGVSIGTL